MRRIRAPRATDGTRRAHEQEGGGSQAGSIELSGENLPSLEHLLLLWGLENRTLVSGWWEPVIEETDREFDQARCPIRAAGDDCDSDGGPSFNPLVAGLGNATSRISQPQPHVSQ